MKIVIDIPDRIYKINQNRTLNIIDTEIIRNAIRRGTILPKGHGRLIDEMELGDIIARMWKNKQITNTKYNTFLNILDYVPTVIERDGD